MRVLINDWVNYYPTLRNRQLLLLNDIVTQEQSVDIFSGHDEYLTYLNLISLDLWKLIRRGKREQEFRQPLPFKQHL